MSKEEIELQKRRSRLFRAAPDVVFLVGLPGSGKSTFAKHLQDSKAGSWKIISQDEIGSRKDCEEEFSSSVKSIPKTGTKVVLDRCNIDPEDRKYWLSLAMNPRNAVAIFFDVPTMVCQERVSRRENHQTIPFGGGENIVQKLSNQLVAPTSSEKFFSVRVVKQFSDTVQILKEFGVDVDKIKEPTGNEDEEEENQDIGTSSQNEENESEIINSSDPNKLFKFPRTRHLLDLGSMTRDDLVYSKGELKDFFNNRSIISVEEKVDGANIGISIKQDTYEILVQNRSHFVTSSTHRQFSGLDRWLDQHRAALYERLIPSRHILFGEWLFAKHSILYDKLPDYFIAFDIYDREAGKFLSVEQRNTLLEDSGIHVVPLLYQGPLSSQDQLLRILEEKSKFSNNFIEGVYCRIDEGEYNFRRGKIVRKEFLQQMDQFWTHQGFVKNQLDFEK